MQGERPRPRITVDPSAAPGDCGPLVALLLKLLRQAEAASAPTEGRQDA
jgi:hypothetical protein